VGEPDVVTIALARASSAVASAPLALAAPISRESALRCACSSWVRVWIAFRRGH